MNQPSEQSKQPLYVCSYVWLVGKPGDHKVFYVADIPRKPGDWTWSEKVEDAKPISQHWVNRFKAYCHNRNVAYKFTVREVSRARMA